MIFINQRFFVRKIRLRPFKYKFHTFDNILKYIFCVLSNTNSSRSKYAQGFKQGKSYCIGFKFTKWPRKAYGKILWMFGYFIYTADNLSSKLDLVESSLIVTKW